MKRGWEIEQYVERDTARAICRERESERANVYCLTWTTGRNVEKKKEKKTLRPQRGVETCHVRIEREKKSCAVVSCCAAAAARGWKFFF